MHTADELSINPESSDNDNTLKTYNLGSRNNWPTFSYISESYLSMAKSYILVIIPMFKQLPSRADVFPNDKQALNKYANERQEQSRIFQGL